MKCPNCGAEGSGKFCEYCGSEMPKEQTTTNINDNSKTIINNYYNYGAEIPTPNMQGSYHSTEAPKKKRKTWLWVLGWILIFPVPLTILMLRNKTIKPAIRYSVIAIAWIALFLIGIFGDSDSSSSKNESEKPAQSSSIDDFEYELSEEQVTLIRYNKSENILKIDSSYEIDGKSYQTNLSEFQVSSDGVETLILDEGISEVSTAIFNGCDVKNIYFPKSMSMVYDYTLSYLTSANEDTINIYYEGTEEEWNSIFTKYERTPVSEAEWGAEKGEALAAKVNEMLGDVYDESRFEYHFSASESELY